MRSLKPKRIPVMLGCIILLLSIRPVAGQMPDLTSFKRQVVLGQSAYLPQAVVNSSCTVMPLPDFSTPVMAWLNRHGNETSVLTESGAIFSLFLDTSGEWQYQAQSPTYIQGRGRIGMATDPNGSDYYIARKQRIAVVREGQVTGELPSGLSGDLHHLLLTPDGKCLVALSLEGSYVLIYARSPETGLLSDRQTFQAVTGSGIKVAGLEGPFQAVATADSDLIIVSASRSNALVSFKKALNGQWQHFQTLNKQETGHLSLLMSPRGMALTGNNQYLYVAASSSYAVLGFHLENNWLSHFDTLLDKGRTLTAPENVSGLAGLKSPERIWPLAQDKLFAVSVLGGLHFLMPDSGGRLQKRYFCSVEHYPELRDITDLQWYENPFRLLITSGRYGTLTSFVEVPEIFSPSGSVSITEIRADPTTSSMLPFSHVPVSTPAGYTVPTEIPDSAASQGVVSYLVLLSSILALLFTLY